jgi:hypothetical protein
MTANPHAAAAPLSKLERTLIEEYIRQRGYDPDKLSDLSGDERDRLLKDASVYASCRLVEVEARSHFLDEIHVNRD